MISCFKHFIHGTLNVKTWVNLSGNFFRPTSLISNGYTSGRALCRMVLIPLYKKVLHTCRVMEQHVALKHDIFGVSVQFAHWSKPEPWYQKIPHLHPTNQIKFQEVWPVGAKKKPASGSYLGIHLALRPPTGLIFWLLDDCLYPTIFSLSPALCFQWLWGYRISCVSTPSQ